MNAHLFKDYDIDYLAVASFAPKCSWRNKVELRMSHLSRLMTGTILPHDTFGSHLRGKVTIDDELEFKNFTAAGEALAEVFKDESFDKHPIVAEFVERKGDPADEYPLLDEAWMVKHCRYALCYVLCSPSVCWCNILSLRVQLRLGLSIHFDACVQEYCLALELSMHVGLQVRSVVSIHFDICVQEYCLALEFSTQIGLFGL